MTALNGRFAWLLGVRKVQIKTKVCVIGAGAGGTGCVYRLIKNGISTVVVDKNPSFGGTMVYSGVDGFEPGVSLDGMHSLLVEELSKVKNAAHVVEQVPNCNLHHPENGYDWSKHDFSKYPWGLSVGSDLPYSETLKRCTSLRGSATMKRFQFEPDEMTKAIEKILEPYSHNLTRFFGYSFVSCKTENGKVVSVTVSDGKSKIEIVADAFVDASGDIVLARNAGCDYAFGTDSKDEYGEPCADEKSDEVNAVTYVFRIAKTDYENHIDGIPDEYSDIDISEWCNTKMRHTVSCFTKYPNGDINVNMLPTMEGKEYFAFGSDADRIGRARIYAYWHYLQNKRNMQGWTLTKIFDAGIRESYRLKGKHVLTENDVRSGLNRQPKIGKTVAIADHALDIHGKDGMCKELEFPYEIPIECAMANEYDNLFVACRGASFSHIASSSIRLSRTMISFGEGVGEHICELLKV